MRTVLVALSAVLISIAIANASPAAPQATPDEPPASPRPRIALVLSGGGALGIAHVGVIRELERMGIRPDLIVGTSMGAIVGGLYAAGYTGDELEAVVASIDWPKLFDDTPPRDGLTYRQKHDQANFPTKWRMRVKDGRLALPTGAISDQNLVLKLRELISAKTTVADFDRLPIPFRCVATDIENGAPVVLKSGDLAAAIRASFSLPGVLPPMQYEDRLLVDGGMAMNIPVEVAHEMGADVLIVVKLSNKLKTQAEIQSAVDVVAQSISLLIIQNEQVQIAKMRPGDVLVDVDLAKYNSASFDRSMDLIEPGRTAANAAKEKLRGLPRSDAPGSVADSKIVLDFIRIKNDTPLDDSVIAARLNVKPGEALDRDQLNKDLSEIYALGSFERVDYSIVHEKDRSGLEVRTIGRKGGFDYLRPSLSLETDFDGEAGYRVSFDYTATALTPYGAEWRVEGVIGDRVRLYSEYFQPLDPQQRWFVMPRVGGQGFDISVYDDAGLKTSKFRAYFAGATLEAGRQFGDWGEIRAGIERGAGHAELQEGFAPVSGVDIEIGRVFVSGGLDTLDEPYFAHHGTRADLRWMQAFEALGSAQDYQTVEANVAHALSWDDTTLILTAGAGGTLSGQLPLDGLFRLGGPFNLSGYTHDELTGEAYARTGALLFTRLNDAEPLLLGLPVYAGASLEMGNVWADPDDAALDDLLLGGSVFVGADTILGPAFIGYGRSENDRQTLFFFFGRPF